jgi:hypothetical protein
VRGRGIVRGGRNGQVDMCDAYSLEAYSELGVGPFRVEISQQRNERSQEGDVDCQFLTHNLESVQLPSGIREGGSRSSTRYH